jgi:hypothetical protein
MASPLESLKEELDRVSRFGNRDDEWVSVRVLRSDLEGLIGIADKAEELAIHLDKTVSVAADAVRRADAAEARVRELEAKPDYYESHEVLGDIVSLESERQVLTGGGPGWRERWDKALQRACEIFED